jgi:CDP-paratose 2-epimerase
MSCIYGPHQFGNEDQGWVAHFLIRSLLNKPLTIYGDGKQVRDILFVEDLVNAFLLARKNINALSGNAFNIGGGVENTISLVELVEQIELLHGNRPEINFEDWRTGDQKYYVSDISKFKNATGWEPLINPKQGLKILNEWLEEFYYEKSPVKEKVNQKTYT